MSLRNLKIQSGRLLQTIHDTSEKFGAKGVWGPKSTETGVCRLSLSDHDKSVRDWFVKETEALGCKVKIDEIGNIFAIYPGQNEGIPTAIGSHLDTQPTGGRYDGILGVLAGLETLRTIKENQYVPKYPIALINWTNEEGARFPMSIMASSVWAENIQLDYAYKLKSLTDEPVTVLEELNRIGYLGKTKASYKANRIAAHFELHIEQGPILEAENQLVGVVVGAQAYSWIKVRVGGTAQHTGTTPLNQRSDALLASSRMLIKGNELAQQASGLFSVGVLNVGPAVTNVIPELVDFIMDVRHVEDAELSTLLDKIRSEFAEIAKTSGKSLSVDFETIYDSHAVKFHPDCVTAVRTAATHLVAPHDVRDMVSGAGHDSCATSTRVPTSMVFIPSRGGISHHPSEYSTPEHVELGFKVLMEAVLGYDSSRSE